MRKSRRLSDLIANIFLAASLAAIWIAFAPVELGGSTSYVIIHGNSMEPDFHKGDLAICRQAADYQVGEVVAYYNDQMNANVIHRIIGMEGDQYVFKGDNNNWIDVDRPIQAEMVGKLWVHLPKLGKAVEWARSPLNMALTTALLGSLLMANTSIQKPNRNRKQKPRAAVIPLGFSEMALYSLVILALGCLGLTIFAFTRPLLKAADKIPYSQTGDFFYSATGAPGVYDSGSARSGEPIFTKLTCTLNLGFVYYLAGDQTENIIGTQQFDANIADKQSGWSRTLPLTTVSGFSGNTFTRMVSLDLCQVQALISEVQQKTGFRFDASSLVITAHISVAGKISGQGFTDSFEPSLTFRFDSLRFFMSEDTSRTNPLQMVKNGSLTSPASMNNTLHVLGFNPSIHAIRIAGIAGLALCLGGLLAVGFPIYKASKDCPETIIRLKYGPILIDVFDKGLETPPQAIDVMSIDDLAKLAERLNAMIMHFSRDGKHEYFVQIEGTTYRYSARG